MVPGAGYITETFFPRPAMVLWIEFGPFMADTSFGKLRVSLFSNGLEEKTFVFGDFFSLYVLSSLSR